MRAGEVSGCCLARSRLPGGMEGSALVERRRHPGTRGGTDRHCKVPPGDPDDAQSRYIEAAVRGVLVACIYLPNGNPQPGPKFDYKLAWFDRLIAHAARLEKAKVPAVLAGDFNVVPTDFDIYPTTSYDDNALLQPAPRAAYQRLLKQGWTDAIRKLHPREPKYTYWQTGPRSGVVACELK